MSFPSPTPPFHNILCCLGVLYYSATQLDENKGVWGLSPHAEVLPLHPVLSQICRTIPERRFETSQKCCIAPQPPNSLRLERQVTRGGLPIRYCWFNIPPRTFSAAMTRTFSAAMNRWGIEAAVRVASATFKTRSENKVRSASPKPVRNAAIAAGRCLIQPIKASWMRH
jgi:hypothetical protein